MKKIETPEERELRLAYLRDWRARKKVEDPTYWSRNYQKHKEYYIEKAKDNASLQRTKYTHYYNYEARKEDLAKSSKKWRSTDHGKAATKQSTASRRQRYRTTLSLLHRNEINEFYRHTPEGHHVDHIIPLRGRTVSGLHVPWNLQYLTASENLRKGSKHDESIV